MKGTSVAFFLGLGLGCPALSLAGFALVTRPSVSGTFYLLGSGLMSAAGLLSPWIGRRVRFPFWTGVLVLVLIVGTRLATTNGSDQLYTLTLPGNGSARWIDRLVDERDVTMLGARILPLVGWILPGEAEGAIPAFEAAYAEIREVGGNLPSPIAATYFGLQRPDAFDAVVLEPAGASAPGAGAIFLHGFAGNFLLECWLFAKAARGAEVLTVCPSAGWVGDWWESYGAEILEGALAYLHTRGVKRVYLAGLSNGGLGAGVLGYKYAGQLNGLVLISGASPAAPLSGLPTLVIHGRKDGRIPVLLAQNYARNAPKVTYHEFEGDHLLLAKEAAAVQGEIRRWLEQQLGAR